MLSLYLTKELTITQHICSNAQTFHSTSFPTNTVSLGHANTVQSLGLTLHKSRTKWRPREQWGGGRQGTGLPPRRAKTGCSPWPQMGPGTQSVVCGEPQQAELSGALQRTPALFHIFASPSLPNARGAFQLPGHLQPTCKRRFEAEIWKQ